jgi:hypothetical protein
MLFATRGDDRDHCRWIDQQGRLSCSTWEEFEHLARQLQQDVCYLDPICFKQKCREIRRQHRQAGGPRSLPKGGRP